MTEPAPAPAWQRGYSIEWLRQMAAPFAAFRPHCHGAFGMVKENAVADAHQAGELIWTKAGGDEIAAVAIARRLKSGSTQLDFAGRAFKPQAGDIMVRAIAGSDDGRRRIIGSLERHGAAALWVEDFIEADHAALWDRLGYQLAGVKVMASSDLKGLWLIGREQGRTPGPLPLADQPALAILDPEWISPADRDAILGEIEQYGAGAWAQHYSDYNKRQSWTSYALQGFDPADPAFIVKPSEMSRKWKAENPDLLKAACGPTPAYQHFPRTNEIIDRLPGRPQRVRMMRLASGNGELSRHADITDPEAGTSDDQIARLHIPLISPPECRFIGWGLEGQRIEQRFPPGALCYLDTRKPHSAINPGALDRIHLVVDLHSGPELRQMIERV